MTLLMIPGPVNVHPRIVKAMSRPMMGHRTAEFSTILKECFEGVQKVLGSSGEVALLSATGTAAMEAAVANLVRGDTVLTLDNGKFGERFKVIAKRYGKAVPLEFEWGESIDIPAVENALKKHRPKVVTMVQNETSTGILNPVDDVAELAREHGALLVVDCITTGGGDAVKADRWGAAMTVVGSQKCLGMPPGLSAVAVSKEAWDRMVDGPPLYLDLKAYRKSAADREPQTPYTPAVTLIFGLQEALRMVADEGLDARIARHRKAAGAIRAAITGLGCELFPKLDARSSYSNTVTAARLPPAISASALSGGMKDRGVAISGGQNRLKGKIFRIAAMGNFTYDDVRTTVAALDEVLTSAGLGRKGAGSAAAESALR